MKSTVFNILVLACLLASATAANAAPRRLLTTRRLRGAPSRRAFAFWKEKFWKKFPTTGAPGLGETLKNTASAYCDKFVEDSVEAAKPLSAKVNAINEHAAQLPTRPTPARFGECVGCGGRALLSLEAPEAPEAPKEEEVTVATKTCTFNRPGSRHNAAPSWFASQPKYDGLHETCVAWFFTGDYIHDVQAGGATSEFCGCCHACDPFGHGHQYGTCNECQAPPPETQTPSPTPEPTPEPTPAPTPTPTPKPYSIIAEVADLRRQSLAVFTDPQLHWIRYDAPNQSGCGFAGCLCKPGSHSQEFDDVVIGVRDEVVASLAAKPLVCPVVQEAIHRIVATNPDLSRPWIVGRGRLGDYPLPFCSDLKRNGPGDGIPSYDIMAATACDNLGLAANDPLLTGRIKYEWLGRNKPGLDNHSGWMTTGKTCATRVADALMVTCVAAVGDRDRPEAQRAPLSTMTQEQMGAYISAWAGDRTLDCSY